MTPLILALRPRNIGVMLLFVGLVWGVMVVLP